MRRPDDLPIPLADGGGRLVAPNVGQWQLGRRCLREVGGGAGVGGGALVVVQQPGLDVERFGARLWFDFDVRAVGAKLAGVDGIT